MITEISLLSFIMQTVLAYHGALYGYHHERDQRYYLQPDSYNYDWPKRHIRKLRPRRNRIHHIAERYRIDTDSSSDCECSCNDCVLPKLCCVPTCATCAVRTDVLYIPYPVPIIVTMPNNEPKNPGTTKITTQLTTRFTTKSTTQATTVPRTESTTTKPCTTPISYNPDKLSSPHHMSIATSKMRPTISSTVKPVRKLTMPPGAPGAEKEIKELHSEVSYATVDYDENSLIVSTQRPKITAQVQCPLTAKCVYHQNDYQGPVPNRRALYGRRRTSDWFSNIEKSLRRTTRRWLPKYGIVSIPDYLARFFVEDIPQYESNIIRQ